MKRTALIAGVSLAALLTAGPMPARAISGDSWSGFSSTPSTAAAPLKSSRRHSRGGERSSRKAEPVDKSPPIPAGPLAVIVSIDKQRATLYADGQPIASTAVSTGTREHPTPMGVFSVIQKDKHHVSNLYNASMPYMQRITWSGSALHEGPLPGYPASHGCVRLTSSFAQMLWKTTKMGARVIVTHPDVAPIDFAHDKLFVPHPRVAVVAPAVVPAAVAAPATVPAAAPAAAPAVVPAAIFAEPALTSGIKIRTANADSITAVLSVVADASKPVATSVVTEPMPNHPSNDQPTKLSETEGAATDVPKSTERVADAPQAQPVEAKPAATAEVKPVETGPVAEVKAPEVKAVEAAPVETKPATIAAPASIMVDEPPKAMPAAVVQEANGRPISVFVSLKEGKLYVRQGWKPLFNVPISFENPSQPIGTHVYTAMGVKADGPELRWTVITIPSGYRRVAELRERNGKSRGERQAKVTDAEPLMPSTPAAALDRIIMPPDLVERISEMITPGSSLIVSDNRLSDETDESTDFIVTTR